MEHELTDFTEIPPAWDAPLVLSFLNSAGFETFSRWIDTELARLEAEFPSGRSRLACFHGVIGLWFAR